ncbi:LysR family transcriptional regulator [Massilia sp. TS11]|uniref:LysR family transcriptional regulator n=1 Tax=Massilia sp. TS11 TaxID=2908003 RepID=UPI001EDAB31F|nr:LysR family transcriptional regulator [Massilia sp. TS11]MCG2583085.1 LysR family transcriptional regulator [Massilia sp. TS11]
MKLELLREMAVFVQVVDSGGFSPAARALGMTTSAVSRHVRRLEQQVGARLLTRTTRAMAVTEIGAQVHASCQRMVAAAREVNEMAGAYAARPSGTLRVSAPVVLGQQWLAPRVPGFLAACPEVELRLSLSDRHVDLIEDGIDLAIRIAKQLPPGLAARPLFPVEYILVASPAYLAAHGTPRHPSELAAHAVAHLGYGAFGTDWQFERGAETVRVQVRSRLAINQSAALSAAAQAGAGIALVPRFAASAALKARALRQLLSDWSLGEPYTGHVYAVYMPGPHLPLKVRALIDHLVAHP